MGTILLLGLVGVLALLGVEYGLYRRAKKREQEGMFDHGLPFISGHHRGDDIAADHRSPDHDIHGPMDYPRD
jgi:hypothetical protein